MGLLTIDCIACEFFCVSLYMIHTYRVSELNLAVSGERRKLEISEKKIFFYGKISMGNKDYNTAKIVLSKKPPSRLKVTQQSGTQIWQNLQKFCRSVDFL